MSGNALAHQSGSDEFFGALVPVDDLDQLTADQIPDVDGMVAQLQQNENGRNFLANIEGNEELMKAFRSMLDKVRANLITATSMPAGLKEQILEVAKQELANFIQEHSDKVRDVLSMNTAIQQVITTLFGKDEKTRNEVIANLPKDQLYLLSEMINDSWANTRDALTIRRNKLIIGAIKEKGVQVTKNLYPRNSEAVFDIAFDPKQTPGTEIQKIINPILAEFDMSEEYEFRVSTEYNNTGRASIVRKKK